MKKRLVLTGALLGGATAFIAGYQAVGDFTKEILYRHIDHANMADDGAKIVRINSPKGLMMTGYLYENDESKRTLIMLHTTKKDAASLADYLDYFQRLMPDANMLFVDCIAHGQSDGYIRGLGARDGEDLESWLDYIAETYGPEHPVILAGEGTGASTILLQASAHPRANIQALISIGAYKHLKAYLTKRCQKETHVSEKLSGGIMRRLIKREIGLDIDDIDVVEAVAANTIPTIYIHSRDDDDVSFRHIFPLYNGNGGPCVIFPIKERYVYEMNQDEEYSKTLEAFLNDYVLISR